MSINKKLIDIIVANDQIDKSLLQAFFKDSFNACELYKTFNLDVHDIDISVNDSDCGFLSNRYIQSRLSQFSNIVKYIKKNLKSKYSDQYAISCDTDIVFFPYFTTKVTKLISENDASLYFMSENASMVLPNIGFIIFRIDENSLIFFEELCSIYASDDRNIMRNIANIAHHFLETKNITYKILDLNFANNNYPNFKYKHFLVKNQLCCFHATNSFNIYEKINLLSKLYTSTRKYVKTFVLPHNYYDWISMLSEHNNDIVTYTELQKKNSKINEAKDKENQVQTEQKNQEEDNKTLSSIEMYISFIIHYYDNLPNYVFFLSDGVFDTTNIAKYLLPDNILYELCDICNIRGGIMCMGNNMQGSTELKLSHKPYPISLSYFLDRIFDLSHDDITQIEYGDSDCYIVRRSNILNRPKVFYENLLKFISYDDYHPMIIEKLMLYIFDLKIPLKHENGNLIL